jgi:outer membrane protein assembly factor BamA
VDFDWTTRDELRLPWRGLAIDTGFDWSDHALGSHWDFWHASVSPRVYWTLFGEASGWRQVVAVKGDIDYAEAFGDTTDVPFFERFFAGGYGTIRGFHYRGVGPRENTRPVGGDFRATASVEYSLPLWRDNFAGGGPGAKADVIRMVFFYDLATLSRTLEDYSTATWRSSFGFGFRLQVPGFPVPFALDFGWPLKREQGDDTELITFFFDLRV